MPKIPDRRRTTGGSRRPRKPVAPLFDWSRFDLSMIASAGRPSLVEELTTYRDRLPELLGREGAYVVIKDRDCAILEDRDAALRYAVEHYGSEPVLIKKIVAKEPVRGLGDAVL